MMAAVMIIVMIISQIKFNRSDSVVVGAEISLDCDISHLTEHTWIVRNVSNNSTVKTYKVHDDTLILPPYSLPYGKYSVTLNVRKRFIHIN